MFDRSVYVTPYVDRSSRHVAVTEKRAPTDESVRLLREMERAAQDSVDKTIHVENCPFDCVVHVMKDFLNDQTVARAHLNLNGKKLVVQAASRDPHKIGAELIKGISEAIARECWDAIIRAFGNNSYGL